MGRPTLLTKEVQKSICEEITGGAYLKDACAVNDITYSTLRNWMKRGANGEEVYLQFFDASKKAEAIYKRNTRANMSKLGKEAKRWEQGAWQLERRFPEDYGKHEVVHHVDEEAARMSLEELTEALHKPQLPAQIQITEESVAK